MLSRRSYPHDLSDGEWNLIFPLATFKRIQRGLIGIHSKRKCLMLFSIS